MRSRSLKLEDVKIGDWYLIPKQIKYGGFVDFIPTRVVSIDENGFSYEGNEIKGTASFNELGNSIQGFIIKDLEILVGQGYLKAVGKLEKQFKGD